MLDLVSVPLELSVLSESRMPHFVYIISRTYLYFSLCIRILRILRAYPPIWDRITTSIYL